MKCKYCGSKVKQDAKFCDRCGKEVGKELTNVEKIEKQVRSMGVTINAFGWFSVIFNLLFYVLQLLNIDALGFETDYSGLLLSLLVGFLFVILGNRIKNVHDKKIKTYLTILLIITIIFFVLAWSTGGSVGLLVLVYMIVSVINYNKFLKEEEYKESLIEQDHKIKKGGWILIIVLSLVLGWFALGYDMNYAYSDVTPSDIEEAVAIIKNSSNLPQEIDEVTIWLDVTAQEDAIRYHYELSGLGGREVSEAFLKDYIKEGICGNRDISNILKGGVNMEYYYTVKETGEKFLVVFTEEDCK